MQNRSTPQSSKLVEYFSSPQGQEVMNAFIQRMSQDGDLFKSIEAAANRAQRNGTIEVFYASLLIDLSPLIPMLVKELGNQFNQLFQNR